MALVTSFHDGRFFLVDSLTLKDAGTEGFTTHKAAVDAAGADYDHDYLPPTPEELREAEA